VITADQPSCFPENVLAVVSSRDDGTMLDRTNADFHSLETLQRRKDFCSSAGVDYANAVYQYIAYGDDKTYDTIVDVGRDDTTAFREHIYADALFTSSEGVGLFLPIADCAGTVVYDPNNKHLALAHLGRHATVANLAEKLVDHFVERGSDASDLIVWMAPHVKAGSYKLDYFDCAGDPAWAPCVKKMSDGIYIDMAAYNRNQFLQKGVKSENIAISEVDTARDKNYYSHSQGDAYGRFAVLAMMR